MGDHGDAPGVKAPGVKATGDMSGDEAVRELRKLAKSISASKPAQGLRPHRKPAVSGAQFDPEWAKVSSKQGNRQYVDVGRVVKCPSCGGAASVKPRSAAWWIAMVLFFPLGLLLLLEPHKCECAKCRIRFTTGGLRA